MKNNDMYQMIVEARLAWEVQKPEAAAMDQIPWKCDQTIWCDHKGWMGLWWDFEVGELHSHRLLNFAIFHKL